LPDGDAGIVRLRRTRDKRGRRADVSFVTLLQDLPGGVPPDF